MKLFEDKQFKIHDFALRANEFLLDNPLFYSGHFITGQIKNPDILFIGINPGHGEWQDIEGRKNFRPSKEFKQIECKYIDEAKDTHNIFAKRILNIVCNGKVERLKRCAETSFTSYFATPSLNILKEQLDSLPEDMQKEHRNLMSLNIDLINPKNIVIIGWEAFDSFTALYNKGVDAPSKKLPIGSRSVDYYAHTQINGIPLHGVRHFSTSLSQEMIDDLKVIFEAVWQDIEKQD